ncbi:hypothetical protein Ddc_24039 [Ditylenchus destructor]|nr:hypothetical protein Ddc_24039 [Ditylenchus destructor]
MKDLGLATFIACVGLASGPQAVSLIRQFGIALPLVGVAVAVVPACVSLFIGHKLLKLDAPVLLGAIAGQQCSTPALSAVQNAAGNATPLLGYTITYAISNVVLPLMGRSSWRSRACCRALTLFQSTRKDRSMEWLHELFKKSPEMALFLSLAVGYAIGKIKFGKFQLGGVAGSLLVAVVVSQVGVQIDSGVKAVLFALFIYAVGFESGPQFFSSLGRQSIKEIVLAAVMAAVGLLTVVVMARLFGLDKGLAAGVAAGGLTQSAIIGTAGDAIAKLGLPATRPLACKATWRSATR